MLGRCTMQEDYGARIGEKSPDCDGGGGSRLRARGGPYDVTALRAEVIEEATRSHPYLLEGGDHHRSTTFQPEGPAAFADPLPEPTSPAEVLHFGDGDLASVRRFVADAAGRRGLGRGPAARPVGGG